MTVFRSLATLGGFLFLLGSLSGPLASRDALAMLTPRQTLVIANRRSSSDVDLARYYMARRKIPPTHLVQVDAGKGRGIGRALYRERILGPVLSAVQALGSAPIRCLVLMPGLPVQVDAPPRPLEEQRRREVLKREEANLKKRIRDLEKTSPLRQDLQKRLKQIQEALRKMRRPVASAALDSELALALVPSYPLEGWLPNPAYVGGGKGDRWTSPGRILVVARLAGASPQAVKKRIDQTLKAESRGLRGIAYFDARWPAAQGDKKRKRSAYALYDRSIHRAAELVRKSGRLPVVVDDRQTVFQPGQCPAAALYCGWYSVGKYVDAFSWVPGAVGYHIESSRTWMKNLQARGVAVTLGPLREPYLQAFPLPHVFFGLLIRGDLTVGEAYLASLPYLSWQIILRGDPLYRPFAK
ncbi:TIGR03790 family protein [Desulfacinum hydrothermale DSM 13146]|uniref:TIGR03790 family protein n=1 Tax=Desulfacinum hydrothermale DSM 13146 TaxID=1121390 RepID=A0A1W1XQW6_9BACT|nr:TIGR03790 family protein [Desulfacinum hydrothermale]SMC26252.1 TIGR03790 family protein [Desulfacinum hydrothermale DSM 13146]